MTKTNYHTHTTRCMHASGADEDYVRAAISAGFEVLGFSDHGAIPFDGGYISSMRMRMDELDGYLGSVRSLAEKHKNDITILCGMEYEYFPDFLPHCRELLDSKRLDYIIFGNHYDLDERTGRYFGRCTRQEHVKRYADSAVAGLNSGLFTCIAHPDLFMNSYPVFDETARAASRDICACAKDLNIPLEYNLLGLDKQAAGVPGLGYPYTGFWEIATLKGCTAIIGVDAHKPDDLTDQRFDQACDTLDSLGIRRISMLDV